MTRKFYKLVFIHVPRSQNILADSLASLSSMLSFPLHKDEETIIVQRLNSPTIQDPWFERALEKVRIQGEDIDQDTTISLLETEGEPE